MAEELAAKWIAIAAASSVTQGGGIAAAAVIDTTGVSAADIEVYCPGNIVFKLRSGNSDRVYVSLYEFVDIELVFL